MDKDEAFDFLLEFTSQLMDLFSDMPCSLADVIDEEMLNTWWKLAEELGVD